MKHSISSFANEIRNNYPGEYDDLNDEVLVSLWLKKYPEDKGKLEIYEVDNSTYAAEESNSDSNFWFYVLAVVAVGIGVFFASNSNSSISTSPSEVAENISNEIQEKVASSAKTINENQIFSQCFSLSDIELNNGVASLNLEYDGNKIIRNNLISKEGDEIRLTNLKVIINDTYFVTGGGGYYTLNGVMELTDFLDNNSPKHLVVTDSNIGNGFKVKLTGDFADKNGNRFNFFETKVFNVKFSCDQFSLERDYN